MKLQLSREEKLGLFIILFSSVFLFLAGISSDLYLGDETFHYRFASYIYQTKSRALYDPLTGYSEVGKIYYIAEPLWHIGLAIFWGLTGGISKVGGQFYHLLYFVFLLIGTYLLAKELYDEERAIYSLLLVATVPMVPAFFIILHLDLPVAVFTTFCFLMLVKKRFFWAGVFLGLSFLLKRNAYFLGPVIAWYILSDKQNTVRARITNFLILSVPVILLNAPDIFFRIKSFDISFLFHRLKSVRPMEEFTGAVYPGKYVFYDDANILYNPLAPFKYLGVMLLFFTGLWVLRRRYTKDVFLSLGMIGYLVLTFFCSFGEQFPTLYRILPLLGIIGFLFIISAGLTPLERGYQKSDLLLSLAVLAYLYLWVCFFAPSLSMRYLSPVIPFLAIIGSGSFLLLERKWLKYVLVLGCVVQFFASAGYTFSQRRIPFAVKQAYQFIRENTSPDARIMCTKNALALHTGRVAMWQTYASLIEVPYLFWNADEKDAWKILGRYKIGYIFVEKDRIYDDSKIYHFGGCPVSFVRKMSNWTSFKLVFENNAVTIWKIAFPSSG